MRFLFRENKMDDTELLKKLWKAIKEIAYNDNILDEFKVRAIIKIFELYDIIVQ
jgi:uncharacterized tellurite resistance protein B-like protein